MPVPDTGLFSSLPRVQAGVTSILASCSYTFTPVVEGLVPSYTLSCCVTLIYRKSQQPEVQNRNRAECVFRTVHSVV